MYIIVQNKIVLVENAQSFPPALFSVYKKFILTRPF